MKRIQCNAVFPLLALNIEAKLKVAGRNQKWFPADNPQGNRDLSLVTTRNQPAWTWNRIPSSQWDCSRVYTLILVLWDPEQRNREAMPQPLTCGTVNKCGFKLLRLRSNISPYIQIWLMFEHLYVLEVVLGMFIYAKLLNSPLNPSWMVLLLVYITSIHFLHHEAAVLFGLSPQNNQPNSNDNSISCCDGWYREGCMTQA